MELLLQKLIIAVEKLLCIIFYKIIKRVIPHQIAVQWLEQLMQVYRSFFTNEQNFLAACDEIEKI